MMMNRVWTIEGVYAPVRGRVVQGIRVKVRDQKDFISFIEQMDLEVLLHLVRPGEMCTWSGRPYQTPTDGIFFSPCVDREDLADDLWDTEQILRASENTSSISIRRKVHQEESVDYEEVLQTTNLMNEDIDIYSIHNRWVLVEQRKVKWD